MAITIRHLRPEDEAAVHEILLGRHVVVGTMRLPWQSLEHTRKRLELGEGEYKLVAEADDRVVGFAELLTFPNVPRHRHVGEVNMIATHADWQGRGVGRALMEAMIALADDWLQLRRLGLTVWSHNETAVKLYQSLGFAVEGRMPDYAFGEGRYVEATMMGRVKQLSAADDA